MILRLAFLAALLTAALATTKSALAVTTNWNTNSTGSYTSAANWSAGIPTSADLAVFNRNLNIEYGVTFPGRPIVSPLVREVKQLKVGTNAVSFSDTVNFNQLPASFKIDAGNTLLEDALIIGDTAGQVATLTSTLSDFSASTVTIGNAAGSTGTLNLNGGTLNVTQTDHGTSTTEFRIGKNGNGTLNVTNGAHLIVATESRLDNTSTATVSGAGSTWQSASIFLFDPATTISVLAGGSLASDKMDGIGNISISGAGSSMVVGDFYSHLTTLSNGATAVVDELKVGDAVVDGAGSTWTVNQSLDIWFAPGLKIRNGAQVISHGTVQIGRTFSPNALPSDGYLEIDGVGSQLVEDSVSVGFQQNNVGTQPDGTIVLKNGGSIVGSVENRGTGTISGTGTITGNLLNLGTVKPKLLHVNDNYSQSDEATLQFDIGGTTPGIDYGRLVVDDALTLRGKLRVEYANGFLAQAGNSFDILDFGGVSVNNLDLSLPFIQAPLKWDSHRLFLDGVLRVILPGDYNDNGTVDAADYVVWREQLVSNPNQTLPNDDTFGVNILDYNTWRANFGQTIGSGTGSADLTAGNVPEPTSAAVPLLAAALVSIALRRRSPHLPSNLRPEVH